MHEKYTLGDFQLVCPVPLLVMLGYREINYKPNLLIYKQIN